MGLNQRDFSNVETKYYGVENSSSAFLRTLSNGGGSPNWHRNVHRFCVDLGNVWTTELTAVLLRLMLGLWCSCWLHAQLDY